MITRDNTPDQPDVDSIPQGYEEVQPLLDSARAALAREGLSGGDWARIRQSMPDVTAQRPPLRWLWALVAGAAAATVIAFGMTGSETDTGQSAPLSVEGVGVGAGLDVPEPPAVKPPPAVLVEGMEIRSAAEATTWTAFGRHSVTLAKESSATLLKWSGETIHIALLKGAISCDVQRASPTESFAVLAGDTTVSVVGTTFGVTLAPNGAMKVSVSHGEVAVSRAGAEIARVPAGVSWRDDASAAVVEPGSQKASAASPGAPGSLSASGAAARAPVPVARGSAPKATRSPRRAVRRRPRGKSSTPPSAVGETTEAPAVRAPEVPPPGASKGTASETGAPEPKVATTETPAGGRRSTTTIDKTISVSQAGQDAPGGRRLLTPIVGLIRGGRCGAAKTRMRSIYRRLGSDRTPPDLFYLMAYCNHVQGEQGAAKAFFLKYRYRSRSRSFKIPASPDDKLPVPRSSQLSP